MDVSLNPLQALSITGKSLRALNTHKILEFKYFSTAHYSHLAVPPSPAGPPSMAEWVLGLQLLPPTKLQCLETEGLDKTRIVNCLQESNLNL